MSTLTTKRLFVLVLSATSLAVSLACAELLLRFFRPLGADGEPRRRPRPVWRELLHQRSAVPGLTYELAPNRREQSQGTMIRTNSFGMRDDEPRAAEGAPVRRIVVLGDSFTFGFGVRGDETYPNVLERLLDAETHDARFEVLNLGVGGYSTRDEALVLEHKGMRWNPELVVVGYVLNDPEIDPVQPLHQHFREPTWWQRLELGRLLASFESSLAIAFFGKGDYYEYLHARERKWRSVVLGFERIGAIAGARDVPVLVVIFPMTGKPWAEYPYRELHRKVASLAREKRLEVLDLLDRYSSFPPGELIVAPGDSHPNELG
ncbi:MAG: SGNH/GDSL hydrolase family protein, partial [Myxococcota bacterium]